MELTLDIFKNDAFSLASLREILPNVPYTPGMISQMGLFTSRPINTRAVLIYEENSSINLIPMTDIGAPDIMAKRDQGSFKALVTKRVSKKDVARAHELTGAANAAFPLRQRLTTAMELVNTRLAKLRNEMAATKELHFLGALQGKLVDADGVTVVYDYFAEFGVAEPVYIDIDFSAQTEETLAFFFTENVWQPMVRALQTRGTAGTAAAMNVTVGALVGDLYWKRLMTHPGFRELWKLEMQARTIAQSVNPLYKPPVWTNIEFAGVRWIHYMGAVTGPLKIANDEARFFPIGAPDVFDVYYSPGETLDTASELGREEYPFLRVDPRDHPEFIEIFDRSYPLATCTYPKALMKSRTIG